MPAPRDFSYAATKDGRLRISHGGRHVTTVANREAERLRSRLEGAGDDEAQQLLARATGHYKHGNERRGNA